MHHIWIIMTDHEILVAGWAALCYCDLRLGQSRDLYFASLREKCWNASYFEWTSQNRLLRISWCILPLPYVLNFYHSAVKQAEYLVYSLSDNGIVVCKPSINWALSWMPLTKAAFNTFSQIMPPNQASYRNVRGSIVKNPDTQPKHC